MSVASGTIVNLATRVAGVVLGLGLTLVTARLGTGEQGAFALFTTVESALLMLGSGFGIAIARRISHHRERPNGLVGATILASVMLGTMCAIVLVWLSSNGRSSFHYLWVLACSAPLMFLTPNLAGLWLGAGRMTAMARITLATPVLSLLGVGVCLIVQAQISLMSVLGSWAAARVVVSLATLAAAWRGGWIARPDLIALRGELGFVAVIGFTNLLGLLNYRVDLFLVDHFLGLSATGVYSVAVLVAELLWLVSSSVTQAAYARIGAPDGVDAGRMTVRVVHASLLALALLCLPLWLAAALFLPVMLGADYAAAVPLLGMLFPGVLAYGAASSLSAYFTNHAGRPLIPAALAGLSLLINVLSSLLLIPRMGTMGAALATSVSYVLSVCMSGWIFSRLSATPARRLLLPDWRSLLDDLGRLRTRLVRHA